DARRATGAGMPPVDLPSEKRPGSEGFSEELKRFEDVFGITEEDLKTIEGYPELSRGQQLRVLKNLEQVSFSEIKARGKLTYQEDLKQAGFLEKIKLGISKHYRIAKNEAD